MNKAKMVIFDWNGTLIDDIPIWYDSIKKIFKLHDINPPSIGDFFRKLEMVKSYTEIYNSSGINLSKEELDQIYQKEYQKHLQEIRLSPGVKETLNILKQKRAVLGIITIQLGPLFDPIFLRLNLKKYFKEVIVEAREKSNIILHLCAFERIRPENCYYVGDSPSDIRQAKKAEVKSIAYLNGYIPKDLILKAEPDFVISNFEELPKLIGK